ncbi:MAG: SelD-related putative sulfur metabolism protein [Desulfurococcales archaeon]|nr:SelD-related putative sulfur metabolism protein [Desulfurococcales archaeon]
MVTSREEVLERIKYYKELGVNPLALATGCAVKVDLVRVVYPALSKLRDKLAGSNIVIAPREDADVFPDEEGAPSIERMIFRLGDEAGRLGTVRTGLSGSRAIVLVQVHQRYAGDPEYFLSRIGRVYEALAASGALLYVGKGHSIVTPFEGDDFMLIDFIKPSGRAEGYRVANNDTIHIIDPTEDPGDYRQVSGALSNSLNDLFVLGASSNITIAPVVNAPSDDLKERIAANVERYARTIGAHLYQLPQPEKGRLLLGATVTAFTRKHPPVFYEQAEKGARIVVTRPIGELAPINVYLAAIMDEAFIEDLEREGLSFEQVAKAKDEAFNTIARPNKEAAQVIEKHLPYYGEKFERGEHIIATTDVTGPGIYVVRELAEQMKAGIRLHDLPLLFPELSKYASSRFLMPNATSGTNGAFVLVVPEQLERDIVRELRSRGYRPSVIGEVVSLGEPYVEAPPLLKDYVRDRRILEAFKIRE